MHTYPKINIIVCGNITASGKAFFDELDQLDLPHKIINLRRVSDVFTYLNAISSRIPTVLVIYVLKNSKIYLLQTEAIRNSTKSNNLSILLYDPEGYIDREEAFTSGVNMYMRKQADSKQFKSKIRYLFKINYQYLDGTLNNETFFVSI